MKPSLIVPALEELHTDRGSDLGAWALDVGNRLHPLLDRGFGTSLSIIDLAEGKLLGASSHGAFSELLESALHRAAPRWAGQPLKWWCEAPPIGFAESFAEMSRLPEGVLAVHRSVRAALGSSDMLGLLGNPLPHVGCGVSIPVASHHRLTSMERTRHVQLSLHLESAVRVRIAPERLIGTISPLGRLELTTDLRDGGHDLMRRVVNDVERVRLRRNRLDGEAALDVWMALTNGIYALVERTDSDGRRHYQILENPPGRRNLRRLSARETNVLLQASRGMTNKAVAYSLGVTESTVSQGLASAAAKLGLPSGRVAVRVVAALRIGTPSKAHSLDALTPAEAAVVELLSQGLDNSAIAGIRGTTQRTVAKQVSSILKKTRASSRRSFLRRDANRVD